MTFKQLQKKLEHYEAGDYQDLLQEIIDKHPEVKAFLEVKFDFLDENKVMSQYEAKIKRELAKKWVDSHGWDGDDIYYKYKPAKAKEYIKEFGKICIDKKNLLHLMFFYFFEYSATIDQKENDYHVLQTVYNGRDQVFVDICKEIKKQNNSQMWFEKLAKCLKLTKRSGYNPLNKETIYFYPLESDLKELLELDKEDLGMV